MNDQQCLVDFKLNETGVEEDIQMKTEIRSIKVSLPLQLLYFLFLNARFTICRLRWRLNKTGFDHSWFIQNCWCSFNRRRHLNIPIEVPPGRKGIEPKLSLSYNSYSSNGWTGMGWNLDLGSISDLQDTVWIIPALILSLNKRWQFRIGPRTADWGSIIMVRKSKAHLLIYYEVRKMDGCNYQRWYAVLFWMIETAADQFLPVQ